MKPGDKKTPVSVLVSGDGWSPYISKLPPCINAMYLQFPPKTADARELLFL